MSTSEGRWVRSIGAMRTPAWRPCVRFARSAMVPSSHRSPGPVSRHPDSIETTMKRIDWDLDEMELALLGFDEDDGEWEDDDEDDWDLWDDEDDDEEDWDDDEDF